MNASSWRRSGAVLVAALVLAGGAALADDKRGRGEDKEWRDYYREREQREAHDRDERSRQERAWREYNRERQGRGYPVAPPAGPAVEIRIGGYFGYPQRSEVYGYYQERARRGFCPPGLAKKNNGCLPPGQARAWTLGRPLPPDVVYYPVEPAVQVRIGLPPPGHEFIRVASDILLIAVGTGMVIDAIEDIQGR
jgi:Ni/Co efflux regulator RcnB